MGFVIMNVRIPCIKGYNEDQIAIVLDDPSMKECPVILETPTLYRAVQVIKDMEITQLAVPWATSHFSYLIQGLHTRVGQEVRTDVGNKNIAPHLHGRSGLGQFKVPDSSFWLQGHLWEDWFVTNGV